MEGNYCVFWVVIREVHRHCTCVCAIRADRHEHVVNEYILYTIDEFFSTFHGVHVLSFIHKIARELKLIDLHVDLL